jgi:hypothetical protein
MARSCSTSINYGIKTIDFTVNNWVDRCHPIAGKPDFGTLDCSGSNSRLGDRVLVIIAVMEKAIEMIL